jgi:hypothetical protein
MIWDVVSVFLVVWVLSTLLIDAYLRRHPGRPLNAHLWPYRASSLADEACEWLKSNQE